MNSFVVSTADIIRGFQFVHGEGVGRISQEDIARLRKEWTALFNRSRMSLPEIREIERAARPR